MALAVIIFLSAIGLTVRAIYGLFAWKGARKKAIIQALGFPIGGFVLLGIVLTAFPELTPEASSERAAAAAERQAEREAERAAREAEREARAQAEAEATAAAEAERLAEAEAQAEAEAAELEACRQDLQCWGQKYSIDAAVRCRGPIERLAQFDMRWTDGWTDTKFPRIRWENQDEGLIIYIGDKAQFQNGFGAWQNVIYTCTYDPATDSAIDVTVTPGRL